MQRPMHSPDGSADRSPWLSRALPLLAPATVAIAVYINTLKNGFVNDDEHQILLNPWIQSWKALPQIFGNSVWAFLGTRTVTDYYRPMMHLVNLVLYRIFGPYAPAYHLTLVLLHAANTVMVVLLAQRLAGWVSSSADPQRNSASWLLSIPVVAGLLFAAHPVHTEAVAWIASLPELLFSLFCLLSLYCYAAPSGPRLAPSLVFFGLALLCKETAVTLPAIFVAFDLALRKEWRIQDYVPLAALSAGYLAWRRLVLSLLSHSYWGLNPFELILNALNLFTEYLRLLVLPVSLNFWRPFHPVGIWSIQGFSAVLTGAVFLAAAAIAWKKHRLCFFSLLLILLPLAPAFYISALPFKVFAERYLYFPSVGFVLLAAIFMQRLFTYRSFRHGAVVFLAVTLILYSTATIRRNAVWRNAYTLYLDTAAKTADAPVPPYDLATKLLNLGHIDEAIAHFRILARVNSGEAAYTSALGAALIAKGELDEGMRTLQAAMAKDPKSLESANNLAVALAREGRVQDAARLYEEALATDSSFPDAHFNYGNLLANQGKTAEAMAHYEAAVRLRPENAYYRNILGIEYAKQGKLSQALAEFQEAVRIAPAEPAYKRNLDHALSLLNEPEH